MIDTPASCKLRVKITVEMFFLICCSTQLGFIIQVFVCSGKDGFVPKYKPDSQEYGCASESGQLRAQYKILVRIKLIY